MNKIEKLVKACFSKLKVLSIVTAAIVALGLVFLFIFGYPANTTHDDMKTVTVKVNQYAYTQHLDAIEDVAENFFKEKGLKYEYDMSSEMYGDESEVVYVFDKDTDVSKTVVAELQAKFNDLTANDSEHVLAGSFINVSSNSERALDRLPGGALLRTVIAAGVFAILACVYVALRHHYTSGLTLFVSLAVSAALTCALVLITRMPITGNLLYTLFFNLLFTAVCVMFTLNKVRKAQKEDKKLDAETLMDSNVATKQVLSFAIANAVALVLVGAIATSAVRWSAAISLLSVVSGCSRQTSRPLIRFTEIKPLILHNNSK